MIETLALHKSWIVFVGTFVLGESVVLTSSALAAQGSWALAAVAMWAFAGTVLSDTLWFRSATLGIDRWSAGERGARMIELSKRLDRLTGDHPYRALLFVKFVYGTRIASIAYMAMRSVPLLLGGERALTKHLWTILPTRYKDRFRIEAGLNFYAIHHGNGLKYRVFKGISQTVKEAKFGFREGLRRRFAMFGQILGAAWDLQWNDLPETDRARRAAVGMTALSAGGMLLGLLVVAGGVAGPGTFFRRLFAEELVEDPRAPLARAVLAVVSGTGATAVVAIGTVILLGNGLFFLRSLARLLTIGRIRQPA